MRTQKGTPHQVESNDDGCEPALEMISDIREPLLERGNVRHRVKCADSVVAEKGSPHDEQPSELAQPDASGVQDANTVGTAAVWRKPPLDDEKCNESVYSAIPRLDASGCFEGRCGDDRTACPSFVARIVSPARNTQTPWRDTSSILPASRVLFSVCCSAAVCRDD